MRRRLQVVAAALSLLGVAACTSETPDAAPSPSAGSSPSAAASSGPVDLELAVYGDEQTVRTYDSSRASGTTTTPRHRSPSRTPPTRPPSAQRLDASFARGDAPDLFLVDHEELPSLVAERRVQPVDELLEQRGVLFGDNYQRLGLEAFSADSALQCMPHDVSPLVVFYNTRLLKPKKLATPDEPAPSVEEGWSWQQFATAARRMSHGKVKGVFVPPDLLTLTPLVRSAGADVVDDERLPTTLTLADDGTREALEQVLTLTRDRQLTPTRRQLARQGALDLFENGRIGMMVGTRRLVPKLRENPRAVLRRAPAARPRLAPHGRDDGRLLHLLADDGAPAGRRLPDLRQRRRRRQDHRRLRRGGPANLQALHSDAFRSRGCSPSTRRCSSTRCAGPTRCRSAGLAARRGATGPMLTKMFYAPMVDLDTMLPAIDARSQRCCRRRAPRPRPDARPAQAVGWLTIACASSGRGDLDLPRRARRGRAAGRRPRSGISAAVPCGGSHSTRRT